MQGNVKKARLYATALGMYEAEINGEPVDDTYFHPGWTNYRKRLQYQTYSVTVSYTHLAFFYAILELLLDALGLRHDILLNAAFWHG